MLSASHCFATALLFSAAALAAPATDTSRTPSTSRSFPISGRRSAHTGLTGDELVAWANRHRRRIESKYGKKSAKTSTKRGSQTLVNYESDSSWYAAVEVGTPAKSYNLVPDTGSSDLWIASSDYDPSSSSTFVNRTTAFSISYGSGDVSGYLGTDTVTMAGTTVTGQTLAVGTQVEKGLIDDTLEGILGLGFQSLSSSGSAPWWQNTGEKIFSFYLERQIENLGRGGPSTTAGGTFTLGSPNTTLYQGDINYSDVLTEAYWLVTMGGLSVQSNTIDLANEVQAAVDTGTTLISGPEDIITALYSSIDGASEISGAEGYWQFPCSNNVSASITFGNQIYNINPLDFIASFVDARGEYCMGAFFASSIGGGVDWIVGDAFLKNVYSIFDASTTPARVGFAALADGLGASTQSSTTNPTVDYSAAGPGARSTALWSAVAATVALTFLII